MTGGLAADHDVESEESALFGGTSRKRVAPLAFRDADCLARPVSGEFFEAVVERCAWGEPVGLDKILVPVPGSGGLRVMWRLAIVAADLVLPHLPQGVGDSFLL